MSIRVTYEPSTSRVRASSLIDLIWPVGPGKDPCQRLEDGGLHRLLRPGQEATPEEILDWCQERMGYFMVPRYVEFRDALPKTATERVQKLELRAEGAGKAWDREQAGYKLKR